MLILEYISTHHVTIYWTSEDCNRQVILTLHLSVGQVILFHISITAYRIAKLGIVTTLLCTRGKIRIAFH